LIDFVPVFKRSDVGMGRNADIGGLNWSQEWFWHAAVTILVV